MTFFKNRSVFFIDLLGKFKGDFAKRSNKQLGKISKAINTLSVINEDIVIKNQKDERTIAKIRSDIWDRAQVQGENRALSNTLSKALS